jgi:hypothetical protein
MLCRQAALSPDALLRLGLLLSSCEGDAITRLRSNLQEIFEERMVQAARPLALHAEQLDLWHHHLETAPAAGMRRSSRAAPNARSSGPRPW